MHKHQCPKCKTIWEHPSLCAFVYGTHYCPVCRTEQTWKYDGTAEADITFFGEWPPSVEALAVIRETLTAAAQ